MRLSCSLLLLATFVIHTNSFLVKSRSLSKHPVVVIISYDGFRPDYLKKTSTPFLDYVKRNGVSVPYMQIQFPTYTFPNHQSIATGLYPESHGILLNKVYDPLYGKVLDGSVDEPGYWNYSADPKAQFSPIVPLYTLNELAGDGRHSGSMMWHGGEEAWGEQLTKATHIFNYNSTVRDWEWEIDQVMNWITHPVKPANLVYLYIHEPDTEGHETGPDSPQTIKQIQRVDNVTGYLLHKLEYLRIKDRVNFIFISDHGMEEIKPNSEAKFLHVIDNSDNSVYMALGKGDPFLEISPVRENETLAIFKAFDNAASGNNYKAYLTSEIPKKKPDWHFTNNRRIMPIILTADLGYVFEGKEPKNYTHGTHGFDQDEPSMRPFFMAMGPAFKENSVHEPFDNIDLYPLVCHILKLQPGPNNGSLEHVLPLLRSTVADGKNDDHLYKSSTNV